MARLRRPYLPGMIFHLTARTVRRERLFTPALRTAAISSLVEVVPRSGARLLAVAIMSNHLHLVVQQGEPPLSALMQPTLRRLAFLLQKAHGLEGPVFWRHYGSQPCMDPRHARNAIAYTHLNPVRAGMCREPAEYPWSSHAFYADGAPPPEVAPLRGSIDPSLALPLFGVARNETRATLQRRYVEFLEERLQRHRSDGPEDDDEAGEPEAGMEDRWDPSHWPAALSPFFHPSQRRGSRLLHPGRGELVPDMATIARAVLSAEGDALPLERLRGRGGGRAHTRLRRLIIRRLNAAGYRNVAIARFLGLSETAVSFAVCSRSGTEAGADR